MITIMIPTMNRSDFLIRLLRYYADTNYKHYISIGDSSNTFHVEHTRQFIKSLNGKLKILHLHCPGLNDIEALRRVIHSVSTPYAVDLPDDDFLVTDALEKCLNFLERHKDYSACHGIAVQFALQDDGPYGEFAGLSRYHQRAVESETAEERLIEYLNNYSVNNFSVHRTETWRAMYKDIETLPDRSFAGEILPSCLSVLYGKVKQLSLLYLLRQTHRQRFSLPNTYDWIISPEWQISYQRFNERLIEELVKEDNIDIDEAKEIVREAFWSYLKDSFFHEFRHYYPKGIGRITLETKSFLKQHFPGLAQVWRILKFRTFPKGGISLPKLLNTKSPYNKDFMPVYNTITQPAKKIDL